MKTPLTFAGHKIQVVERGEEFRGFIDGSGKTWGKTEAEAFDACVDQIKQAVIDQSAREATDILNNDPYFNQEIER